MTLRGRNDVINQMELEAFASYEVADDGTVDVTRDAPIDGTYSGVDPDGLIWSADIAEDGENRLAFDAFEVRVEQDGAPIATGTLDRYYLAPNALRVDSTFAPVSSFR